MESIHTFNNSESNKYQFELTSSFLIMKISNNINHRPNYLNYVPLSTTITRIHLNVRSKRTLNFNEYLSKIVVSIPTTAGQATCAWAAAGLIVRPCAALPDFCKLKKIIHWHTLILSDNVWKRQSSEVIHNWFKTQQEINHTFLIKYNTM